LALLCYNAYYDSIIERLIHEIKSGRFYLVEITV